MTIDAILNGIVQKRGTDRVGVKSQLGYYSGNRYGVRYIWISADAELSLVKSARKIVRHTDLVEVVLVSARFKNTDQMIDITVCHIGLHHTKEAPSFPKFRE